MTDLLYKASQAGVKIEMIVRGICSVVPGVEGMSENIEVISIVDKFLEHPRIYQFHNGGDVRLYISSADFMTRNLDFRVEVAVPIYDEEVKQEIMDTFDICWQDNVKARIIDRGQTNQYRPTAKPVVRSQFATYDYYLNQND
jgi:polyphosphate kinase